MFERFTARARRVVVLAQEEARELHHDWIGTEHILLGLLREGEGVAARVLTTLSVTYEDARAAVIEKRPPNDTPPSGHIPFTPHGKKALELALREALQLGHNYVGTEHVILGLIREAEGTGPKVLSALRKGLTLELARKAVLGILMPKPEWQGEGPPPVPIATRKLREAEYEAFRKLEDAARKRLERMYEQGMVDLRLRDAIDALDKTRQPVTFTASVIGSAG